MTRSVDTHLLDRPVWHSLIGPHAALSVGGAQARRFAPEVNMFASGPDDGPTSCTAIASLYEPDETFFMIQRPGIPVIPGTEVLKAAPGVQMVMEGEAPEPASLPDIVPLGLGDAPDMLALAQLTEPGPFLSRTLEMGQFFGVRRDGRLAAMAGERLRFDGYSELSGVCTHPDFQGHGLARPLSRHVCRRILARGETPFLHAWASNDVAIGLYESLGFVYRCHVNAVVLKRLPD